MTMPSLVFTRTDVRATEWALVDEVVRLRRWATNVVHWLPESSADYTIGATKGASLCLEDPSQLVSRLHARLVRERGTWVVRDLGSKNGIRLDGARRSEICLAPGLEIGIGGVTLIAESELSMELRSFVGRLLGWEDDRGEVVDRALRAIRMAASCRAALVLVGDGDLVPVAHAIHDRACGAERPFVVCDPRRKHSRATVRSAENHGTGLEALAAAKGGTLCLRSRRLPPAFSEVVERLHEPDSRTQLIICAETLEDCERYGVVPIAIPALRRRGRELDRIIREYAKDAVHKLATGESAFTVEDLEWVREHAGSSLPEIEKATHRRVALRAATNLTDAAARLGMAPVSLSRWLGRRGHTPEGEGPQRR